MTPGETSGAAGTAPRIFYAHVMKTGGSTLRDYAYRSHADGEVYPDPDADGDMLVANRDVAYVLGLPLERLRRIRVFTGHFPWVVSRQLADRLGEPLATVTMLREPIERVVSHLKHVKRYMTEWADAPFEAIFDDPYLHAFYFTNYQTRLFAFTEQDRPQTQLDQLDMDDHRLEVAKEQLAQVDHIGLQEHHRELVERMQTLYGWQHGQLGDWRVSRESWTVPDALLRRIEADNALDLELYDHARHLWAAQQP